MFNNTNFTVTFQKSARRHKVGRARVLEVLRSPRWAFINPLGPSHHWTVLGEDLSGRVLEIVAAEEGTELVVIHAMDLRRKYRAVYEEGMP